MQTVTLTLAGEEYKVEERPRRANRAWRLKLQAELAPVIEFLGKTDDLDLDTLDTIAPFVTKLIAAVDDGLDKALALVLDYMDRDDPDWLENFKDQVYDSEIAPAFMEVLALAYPLGSIAPVLDRVNQIRSLPGRTP